MTLTRGRFANVFALASEAGPYGFWPVIPAGLDPQFYVSLNDRPQPFHLVHEHDAVLVHFSGDAEVRFPEGPVRWYHLTPGDHIYLPAGLPYRVVTGDRCVQLLMKADIVGMEALAFYCDSCAQLIHRVDFDTDEGPVQRRYYDICALFNKEPEGRRCPECGEVAPEVDLAPYAWLEVADQVEAGTPSPAS